jgi:hypothetical protein
MIIKATFHASAAQRSSPERHVQVAQDGSGERFRGSLLAES